MIDSPRTLVPDVHHEQARRVAHGRVPPDRRRAQAVDRDVRQLTEALHHLAVDAAPGRRGLSRQVLNMMPGLSGGSRTESIWGILKA